jgi:hypothetical protein
VSTEEYKEWYHQLCMVALQMDPWNIDDIPKRVLRDPRFVKLVADSSYRLNLDEEELADVRECTRDFLDAVQMKRLAHFAVATSRHPLPGLPLEIAGTVPGAPYTKSRVAEYLAGSRKRRRKTRRKRSRGR